jgi:hypothetical protein
MSLAKQSDKRNPKFEGWLELHTEDNKRQITVRQLVGGLLMATVLLTILILWLILR